MYDSSRPAPADTASPLLRFEEFCANALPSHLMEVNDLRRSVRRLFLACFAPPVIAVVLIALRYRGGGLYFVLMVAWIVAGGLYWHRRGRIYAALRERILPAVAACAGPGFDFSPGGSVKRGRFMAGGLFKGEIAGYDGGHHLSGRLGRTWFEFSELCVTEKGHRDEADAGILFRGVYFVADCNKRFATHTVVLPDTLQRGLGQLGQALQAIFPQRGQLIRLEDPEFEKKFVVYGEDQVEARYLLTPALMQRMVAVDAKLGGRVHFAFAGSHVHVAIPAGGIGFEPSSFTPGTEVEILRTYFERLRSLVGIVEDLDLNTRVWTKG